MPVNDAQLDLDALDVETVDLPVEEAVGVLAEGMGHTEVAASGGTGTHSWVI